MTEDDLKLIEERAAKATKGPWVVVFYFRKKNPYSKVCICKPDSLGNPMPSDVIASLIEPDEDADFIAHAREDVPALIAEVRRLQKALVEIREKVRESSRIVSELESLQEADRP